MNPIYSLAAALWSDPKSAQRRANPGHQAQGFFHTNNTFLSAVTRHPGHPLGKLAGLRHSLRMPDKTDIAATHRPKGWMVHWLHEFVVS